MTHRSERMMGFFVVSLTALLLPVISWRISATRPGLLIGHISRETTFFFL